MAQFVISFDQSSQQLLVTKHCAASQQLLTLMMVHLDSDKRHARLELLYDRHDCECGEDHNMLRDQGCELCVRCVCTVLRAQLDPASCSTEDRRDALTWLSESDSFRVAITKGMVKKVVELLTAFGVGADAMEHRPDDWQVSFCGPSLRFGLSDPKTLH